MKHEQTRPKHDKSGDKPVHGCCGGAPKKQPEEVQPEVRCGCGDKHAKSDTDASCCK